MKTGHAPDQNLLLLAHHALSPWRSLGVKAHLRHCAECQQRLTQLRQTSQLMASTIRDPADLPWHPASQPRGFLWQAVTLIFLTLILMVGFAVWTINHHTKRLPRTQSVTRAAAVVPIFLMTAAANPVCLLD